MAVRPLHFVVVLVLSSCAQLPGTACLNPESITCTVAQLDAQTESGPTPNEKYAIVVGAITLGILYELMEAK